MILALMLAMSLADSVSTEKVLTADSLPLVHRIEALEAAIGFRMLYLRDTLPIDQCMALRRLGIPDSMASSFSKRFGNHLTPIPQEGCGKGRYAPVRVVVKSVAPAPGDSKVAVLKLKVYAGHYVHDETYRLIRDWVGPKIPLSYSVMTMLIDGYSTESRVDDFR